MGRYAVKEKIARGGMAVVYRGEDERLHRPVCVKVFFGFGPHQQEYAVVLEHFVQEAFALSRLRHPATLRIYDFGYLDEETRSEPFFVTEYAEGGHLGQLVSKRGALPPQEVLRLLGPIVGALREAHEAGIVHRDLKPSNILLTSAGGELSAKLADFSIAKAHSDLPNRASETNAQAPLYSLSWAAPEQMSGGKMGPAVDVFALALLTAYLLTKKMVYPGEDVMALYTLRSEGPRFREESIRGLGLPSAAEALVLRACREDPNERPPSVEAFFGELEGAIGSPRSAAAGDDEPTDSLVLPSPKEPRAELGTEPSVTEPFRGSKRQPPRLRPVSPGNPAEPTEGPHGGPEGSVSKPRLPLSTLDAAEVVVGHRRMRVRLADDSPVELADAFGSRPARLRVTPQELGAGRIHLKGLNCFLRTLEGRPSSGLDVDRPRSLELLDPQSGARAQLRITMGARQDGSHELELGDTILVVPAALARWAVVLESGRDTLLLYRR